MEEMKAEAIRALQLKLDAIHDEQVLNKILELINNIDARPNHVQLSRHYTDIKNKYGDVLKKLAE